MGEYFLIVNPAKKQYINASRFGESIKRRGIMRGNHADAVGLLIVDRKVNDKNSIVGTWAGDPIIAAGDYSLSNILGFETSSVSEPNRNLYLMALEEFDDISHLAIMDLINIDEGYLDDFVNKSLSNTSLMVLLGDLVFVFEHKLLKNAFVKIIGKDWTKKYKEACNNYVGFRVSKK